MYHLLRRLPRTIMPPFVAAAVMLIAIPSWAGQHSDTSPAPEHLNFKGTAENRALWDAALNLDLPAVRAALKMGANPNATTTTPRPATPLTLVGMGQSSVTDPIKLHRAAEAAKLLFAAGAKLGPADSEILFFPISSGNLELARVLVENGASSAADLDGFTPPELAQNYGQKAVYDYLVSVGGPPVDAASTAQITLVSVAGEGVMATARNEDVVADMDLALKQGARVNDAGPNNRTALIAAVRTPIYKPAQVEVIRWLLDHGADPNQEGDSSFEGIDGLPLHIFVAMNKDALGAADRPEGKSLAENAMNLLLQAGAKVSGMDKQGRTPLHLAAKFDDVRAAEILIQAGAKIMPRDLTGRTPLDYAESAPMIRLLKAHGATEH